MDGPIVTLAFRLALRNRQLAARLAERDAQIERLCERLRGMHADVDLMALCVPLERRRDALALVRDRHRLEATDEYQEEAWR